MEKSDERWCELAKDQWSDEHGFGVYVIELDREATGQLLSSPESDLPALYVGSSYHSAERRMWTHFCGKGHLSSKWVRKHGLFLRYDLFKHMRRYETREEAEAEEEAHARRLARLGFRTHCDGIRTYFDRSIAAPQPSDVERDALGGPRHMRAIEDYVDQAIFSVVAALRLQATASDARTVSGVAATLTAGRANRDRLDSRLEAEGRFAYSRKELIEVRVKELLRAGFLREETGNRLAIVEGQLGN